MSRLLPLALSATLLACAVCAAPAPLPKPWVNGWDKPVDPLGDCKLCRKGDVLTIEVPGKEHLMHPLRLTAPHLQRNVKGDFVAQVRVSGTFQPSGPQDLPVVRAGLVVMDGKTWVWLERNAYLRQNGHVSTSCRWELDWAEGGTQIYGDALYGKQTYFQLERAGDSLRAAYSEDGKNWTHLKPLKVELATKLKLALYAATTSSASFRPRFDQFKLTQSKK